MGARTGPQNWQLAAERLGLKYRQGTRNRPPQIRGNLGQYRLRAAILRKLRVTRFEIRYPSLNHGLQLHKQGFFSKVGSLVGRKDIRIGFPVFDRQVIVHGFSEERVRRYMTARRRRAILRFLAAHPDGVINDESARFDLDRIVGDAATLTASLLGLRVLARDLSRHESERPGIARALELRRDGELTGALAAIDDALEESAEPDESVQKAEILMAAGREDEARRVLDEALRELTNDVELSELLPGLVTVPPLTPLPGEPPPLPSLEESEWDAEDLEGTEEPTRDPEPGDDGNSGDDWGDLLEALAEKDAARDRERVSGLELLPPSPPPEPEPEPTGPAATRMICEAIYGDRLPAESLQVFSLEHKGRPVQWEGELLRVRKYRIDVVFGRGPGLRATLRLTADVAGEILAVVQLPSRDSRELEGRVGQTIRFQGILSGCDAYMRNFFVSGGRWETKDEDS